MRKWRNIDSYAKWRKRCAHLHDKPAFFVNCCDPAAGLAICSWLAADAPDARQAELIAAVCHVLLVWYRT
ncbi:MAG: hypothetical protein WED15_02670 [Akkermansiaceae bacterium]